MKSGLRITIYSALYRYIEDYAAKMNKTPITACIEVLDETEKVLNLILGKKEENRVE